MLSLVELSGSPFSVGSTLGKFGAPAAHDYLIHSESWASVMAWRGSDAAASMLALVDAHFPQIRQELEGLASGLELPFEDVFLWNCRGDLWSMPPDGCTTVQLPGRQPRITHNEDGDPGFAGHCGLGLFRPDNGPAFASFLYPASIPGHTFAVTAHGLAMTVNNLRSRQITAGVPRMVITRAILNQTRLENALTLLRSTAKSGGFHLSLAQSGQPDLYTVEFNALGVSTFTLTKPALHANHLIHPFMRDHAQLITDSSRYRQERGNALLAQGVNDPLRILADQENKVFPIYRNAPDDSDNENTMATADLHIGAGQVDWCVYEQPGEPPRYRLTDASLV
ncbi:C45 family peptidase [Pusillimonas sp. MFBS29]|uniref:C45 family autoproteolytic acyltransferase/hydolase n=1 Tax=Pusillimonas sp. MFBS29 TaxID=2886690 RepID=UPI001D121E30|nr:C45 family peptidase [Pusillimonas sp. MFBS29]MCC2596092.1 C45 family peptidase [Pusillimonas sp. MFBS29]